jgi:hypothetical protein
MPDNNAKMISEGNVTAFMYDKLSRLYGEGSQLFTMEMPGRTLNHLDYAYDIKDHNTSVLGKPYAVAEREFRLCDDLFDVTPIAQGPNGVKLSKSYSTLINNYTPDIKDVKDFVIDKMHLRLFLLQEITDEIDGEEITCSRMEFCQRLYMKYLKEKHNWDQEKIDTHEKAIKDGNLDGYARWLATTAWTKDQALENMFHDAVIRGFYHEIMTILGFLDSASPSERLAQAKGNARSSVRRSLDGSMDVYPVQFQPSNWFRALSPNFSPKDLTLDPDYLTLQYQTKVSLLSTLETELGILLRKNIGDEELANMKASLADLESKYHDAEKEVIKNYSEGLLEGMKAIIQVAAGGDVVSYFSGGGSVEAILGFIQNNEQFADALGLPKSEQTEKGDPLSNLVTAVTGMYISNLDYFELYNEIVDLELALVSAETSNYNDEISILKERIRIVSNEVEQLRLVLASGVVNGSDHNYSEDADLLPSNIYNEEGEFAEVIINKGQVTNAMEDKNSSTYKSVNGSINQFIFTTNVKYESSESYSSFVNSLVNSDFTIGFRAFKVSFDRGGWFDAGVLELAPSYRRIREKIKGGLGLDVDTVMAAYNVSGSDESSEFHPNSFIPAEDKKGGYSYILQSYPMGCLIAKDIVIKAKMDNFNESDYQTFKKTMTTAKASLFGWQLGGGVSHSATCGYHKTDSSSTSATFIMRIPGPQIIGWFQELTPLDTSMSYESFSKSEYFNEIVDLLKEYSSKMNELSNSDKNIVTITEINRIE